MFSFSNHKSLLEERMNYIQIDIETTRAGVEIVVGKLLSMGITDTVVDDPGDFADLMENKKDYEWDYVEDDVVQDMNRNPKLTVYLEDNDENRELAERIEEEMINLLEKARDEAAGSAEESPLGFLKVVKEFNNDQDWKDKWKEYFKPTRISKSIVVKPTWESYENKQGDKVIEIDPGMAFGTGTHETTSLCVKLLETYMKPQYDVLDVGCGSGILSIAAALLGARDVLGIDIDPTAVDVAKENLELNKVDHLAKAQEGDLTSGVDYKADIIVANLMADLVVMLASDAKRHLKDGGYFISSGILVEKEKMVSSALIENGFEIVEVVEDGEWCAIVAEPM